MSVELAAEVVEGAHVEAEPVISGVQLAASIIEGAELAGEVIAEPG